MKKKFTIFTLSISLIPTIILAQESITVTSAEATGLGGSASYSVGQLMYTTTVGSNASISEGVQQPYEISEVLSLKEAEKITFEMTAFPNPTTDLLKIKIENYANQQMNIKLLDNKGKIIQEFAINEIETHIDFKSFPAALYTLQIIQNNTIIKIVQISKI
ncbi:MAG: T9SS type A sorting domain-containing protein [Flavobacteriia bacterium]|nr:T9SS type A sorting domain-containing protein [Flavobacteriia bacterium]